jgi:hypothetical protein
MVVVDHDRSFDERLPSPLRLLREHLEPSADVHPRRPVDSVASGADFARKVDEAGFPGVLEAVDRSLRAVGDESSRSVALAS